MDKHAKDLTLLVTGGTSGIGEATVRRFADAGARVAFCGRRHLRGSRIEAEIRATGGLVRFVTADVRDPRQVERFVRQATEMFGSPDVAINNAGISHNARRAGELAVEEFEDVFATNVRGLWLSMKAEIALMKKNGHGIIINLASALSDRSAAWLSAYGASKHAVAGLTKSAAEEYSQENIRIVALAPGPVDTAMYRRALEDIGPETEKFAGGWPESGVLSVAEVAETLLNMATGLLDVPNGAIWPMSSAAISRPTVTRAEVR